MIGRIPATTTPLQELWDTVPAAREFNIGALEIARLSDPALTLEDMGIAPGAVAPHGADKRDK